MIRSYLRFLALLSLLAGLTLGLVALLPEPCLAGECPSGPCCTSIVKDYVSGAETTITYDCVTKQVIRIRVRIIPKIEPN